jgi:hypothetical protein
MEKEKKERGGFRPSRERLGMEKKEEEKQRKGNRAL